MFKKEVGCLDLPPLSIELKTLIRSYAPTIANFTEITKNCFCYFAI